MQHTQFINFEPNDPTEMLRTLNFIYPHLNADSAHLAILRGFQDLSICDGGDDDLALYDTNFIIIYLAQFITPAMIEDWDNQTDESIRWYHDLKRNLYTKR